MNNWEPITESIPIFEFRTLRDRTECDLVLPWEILLFQLSATAILWDTALFGAHSPHMSVETARPDAGVPLRITKT